MRSFLRFCCVVLLTLCTAFGTPRMGAFSKTEKEADSTAEVLSTGARVTRFLVLGRDRAAGLTDSILVVAINEDTKQVGILQIPRDTFAAYTQKDYKKLNGALNELGAGGIKTLLSEALCVRLDYFVILDLSCLRQTVNALGGVEVDVPQNMEYSDPAQGLMIRLSAGRHRLNGEEAEQFVRYRSGYANADLGRLDAQKLFLQGFAKQCKSVPPTSLLQAACTVLTKVQTDIGLSDAIRVVEVLRRCDAENIPMATVSGEAVRGVSGAWYFCINRAGAMRDVNECLFPSPALSEEIFDPHALFDRRENVEFHQIYIAPDKRSASG